MRIRLLAVTIAGALGATPASAQVNINAEPNYGAVDLSAGFTPDPRVIALRAGGSLAASSTESRCSGFVTSAPDVRLNYDAGSLPLIVSVASSTDTTLMINAPDESFHCDDDSGLNGGNPSIRFNTPTSGRYEIWVGTYQSGDSQPARLHISEVSSQ